MNQRLRDQEKAERPTSHLFQSPADLRSPQLLRPEVSDPLQQESLHLEERPEGGPSAERSSSVAEGSLPAAERSSGEEFMAVVGSPGGGGE